ncbi:MAG: putative sugar nucleotidyltransferase and phosphatidyltransferase (bifunctional enzyme) [Verrucomicrobia bacterium]|nr:putative sugar nucleotidyltransferase and phosphatidyltransferase (bifunctional enzyme) [Verrucomicrobiota bacterium]
MNPPSPITFPALLVCEPQTGGLKVAALTLLDRLVVAAHRGGASPITIVCSGELPELKRTKALGIPFAVVAEMPAPRTSSLIATTSLHVQTADVKRLIQEGGRLLAKDGTPLPIGLVPSLNQSLPEALNKLTGVTAQGVALPVTDAASAQTAERALWASLTSSADGLVDKVFNRPCGRPLSKLLIHTPVTPNAVSIISILTGVVAALFFAQGDSRSIIIGAILFQISAIIDCVDGDIARAVFKESPLGKWLDLAGDQVVHISVFACIAIGLVRTEQTAYGTWLGLSAVLGAILSFIVIVRGMRYPPEDRNQMLQKLIDSATNRDFSVLVFILACFQGLEWFLWMTAIGSHVFWMVALALQPSRPLQPSPR